MEPSRIGDTSFRGVTALTSYARRIQQKRISKTIHFIEFAFRRPTQPDPSASVSASDERTSIFSALMIVAVSGCDESTNVIAGLFYEFVVVTEADADRAFYQEINERQLRLKPDAGIPNCLFLNAQGKHTVHTIIRPLRKLGIPAAAVVDVDLLKDQGSQWSNLLDAAKVPPIAVGPLGALRSAVRNAMDQTGRDMKKDGGIAILQPADQEAARNLFNQLAEYGIFVVPGGELESWLKPLNVSGHGPAWLNAMFEKMGEDPDAAGFVKPGTGDVWEFGALVRAWLVNTSRKGIPS